MKSKILGLLATGLLAAPFAADATVSYTFSGTATDFFGGGLWSLSFALETPSFIVGPQTIAAADLLSCSAILNATPYACSSQTFSAQNGFSQGYETLQFGVAQGDGAEYFFYFPNGSFGAVGTYDSELLDGTNDGILTVREVPEPGTLALLGLGLAGLGLSRRRKA